MVGWSLFLLQVIIQPPFRFLFFILLRLIFQLSAFLLPPSLATCPSNWKNSLMKTGLLKHLLLKPLTWVNCCARYSGLQVRMRWSLWILNCRIEDSLAGVRWFWVQFYHCSRIMFRFDLSKWGLSKCSRGWKKRMGWHPFAKMMNRCFTCLVMYLWSLVWLARWMQQTFYAAGDRFAALGLMEREIWCWKLLRAVTLWMRVFGRLHLWCLSDFTLCWKTANSTHLKDEKLEAYRKQTKCYLNIVILLVVFLKEPLKVMQALGVSLLGWSSTRVIGNDENGRLWLGKWNMPRLQTMQSNFTKVEYFSWRMRLYRQIEFELGTAEL